MNDLRKISSTSDFYKVYESFLKDWIMEDIDICQIGGQSGIGTEHMLFCLVHGILTLLDTTTTPTAVIAAMIDSFNRQDPT